VRQLWARLRHRVQLVRLRTLLRNRIHAVLADHGHDRPAACWSGPGRDWLAGLDLPAASREVVEDCLAMMDALQLPIDRLDRTVRHGHIWKARGGRPRSPASPRRTLHPSSFYLGEHGRSTVRWA
jgi:transposase